MSTLFTRVGASARPATALALIATLALGACAAPDLGPKPLPRTPQSLASDRSLPAAPSAAWPQDRWWTAWGDPALDALVDEALAGSPDVALAAARIRQAEGVARVAGAGTQPQLGADGSAGATKQSYNAGVPKAFVPRGWKSTGTLALSGEFDLDLWGRQRAALAAATSETQAARAEAAQAALMLSTNVVSSYLDLARLVERGAALDRTVAERAKAVSLTRQRAAAGLENQGPVRATEASLAEAQGAASANAEAVLIRRHALAALLGKGPDRGLEISPASLARIPATPLPADVGIGLAGRRPDVIAARLRVEASSQRIRSAKAAFLPDISLRGLVGLTSLGLSNLIDTGSTYGNAGAALSLPIFSGGQLEGQFTQARGGYDAAVAAYDATLVGALQEVADAYASRAAAGEQEAAAARARTEAEGALGLAEARYRNGLSTWLDALVAEDRALAARTSAIDARFRTLARDVALIRALGGGIQTPLTKAAQ